jgi:hypothetical protein
MKSLSFIMAALCGLFASNGSTFAQGTTFTYEGRLNENGSPANGNYDFAFSLFNTQNGGSPNAGPMTNASVAVSNGLFIATLDFGNAFDGSERWLQIDVRTNGGTTFSPLAPRQQILPAPYAMTAGNALTLNGQSSPPPAPGSANYIQNQSGIAQGASFNISGDAMVGGALYGGGVRISDGIIAPLRGPVGTSPPGAANSANMGAIYFDAISNALMYSDGTAWRKIVTTPVPAIYTASGAVAAGATISLAAGFSTFPSTTIWVQDSGSIYNNMTGNASFPVAYDAISKTVTVTNNSSFTKIIGITTVGQ